MDMIQEAIIEANILGKNGIEVIDYIEPQSAAEDPKLKLIGVYPPSQSWWDL